MCKDVLAECEPCTFENKLGQFYLKLDEKAYFPFAKGLTPLNGHEACFAALEELCRKSNISDEQGFRRSRKPGYVELYPALQKILFAQSVNDKITLCKIALEGCELIEFKDKPGQNYLELDKDARFSSESGSQPLRGHQACIAALKELCDQLSIEHSQGFRESRKPGFVEIYSPVKDQLFLVLSLSENTGCKPSQKKGRL